MRLTKKQQGHMRHTSKWGNAEFRPHWKGMKARLAPKKLYLRWKILQQWGKGLSKAQQEEAWDLFLEFGYNVLLSNQLPYNRSIPDTRDIRCAGPGLTLQDLIVVW